MQSGKSVPVQRSSPRMRLKSKCYKKYIGLYRTSYQRHALIHLMS